MNTKKDPTIKQKRYVKERLSNPSKSMRQAALDAGYSLYTASNAGKDIEKSEGVQALMEAYGLDDKLIIEALRDDIKAKKGKRVAELRLASEMRGLTGNRQGSNLNINIANISDRYKVDDKA